MTKAKRQSALILGGLVAVSLLFIGVNLKNKDNDSDLSENRLLLKEGTDKITCSNAPSLPSSYVDNYWNSYGNVKDGCEIIPDASMAFILF